MKYLVLAIMAMLLVGCGSDKTYNTYETNATVEEPYPVPDGMAIIVDDTTDSEVYTNLENTEITIDCGGTCGDITIGVPVP